MGTSTTGMGWPDGLVKVLLDGGRQVIRRDHRDTGRSDCVDFATRPYTPADLAADAMAVLDGHGVATAHVAGSSLGGAIGQWLAVHRPERVLTLTAIMTGPMGHNAGPAFARALAGRDPDPDDLPPPAPRFLQHLARLTAAPPATREERVAANHHLAGNAARRGGRRPDPARAPGDRTRHGARVPVPRLPCRIAEIIRGHTSLAEYRKRAGEIREERII